MLTMLFILTFIVVLICGIIGFTKHKTPLITNYKMFISFI